MRCKARLPLRWLVPLALFSFCLGWPARADDSKWTSITPDEGEIVAVVIDPVRSDIVYAGTTAGGIVKTTDGGATWRSANAGLGGPELPEVRALAVDSRFPDRLFAATATGVFRTDNGGRAWARIDNNDAYELALIPSNGDIIFVDRSNTLFKSTNGGRDWTPIRKGKAKERIHTLRINPANPNVIYAGNHSEMIKSTDGGASWASCQLPLTRVFDKPMQITSPSIAYPHDIVLDPANPNVVYVATSGGILKSTDGGANWVSVNAGMPGPNVSALAIDPLQAKTVYAATSEHGLFKSWDGGARWAESIKGLGSLRVNTLAAARSQKYLVYAATARGIFKSVDGGAHWSLAKVGMHDLHTRCVVVSPADSNIIYAQFSNPPGLRSTDRGVSWEPIAVESPSDFVRSLTPDPSDAMTVYAASTKGLLKSLDGGMNWTALRAGLPENYSYAVALDPTDSKVLYAMVSSNEYPVRELSGIYKSTDAGASWQRRSNGLGEGLIYVLAIAPSATQTLYTNIGSVLYKSTDGGANWSPVAPVGSDVPYGMAVDAGNPNVVFAATAGGLYKTTNGGESWRRLVIGPKVRGVRCVATDSQAGSLIYAGTSDGVFVSADGGERWAEANYGLPSLNIYALAVDPSDPDLVYAGTAGAGIVKRRFAILTVSSVVEARRGLTITGRHFSLSPRVFINGVDCSEFIVNASDQLIQLRGSPTKLRLKPGDNHIQVTNTELPLVNTQEGSSNVYVLKRQPNQ